MIRIVALGLALLGFSSPAADPAPRPRVPREPGTNQISKLIEQLGARNLSTRLRALDRLGRLGPEAAPAQPALIATLGDPEVVARNQAAWALGTIGRGDPEAIRALSNALSDPAWTVGHNASLALAGFGDRALPVLRTNLAAPLPRARLLAARALISIDPAQRTSLVPVAMAGLELQSDEDLTLACRLIASMGDATSNDIPRIAGHLGSTNRVLRYQIAEALGQLGPTASAATPLLIQAAGKDTETGIRLVAITSLGKIREPRETILPFLLRSLAATNERLAGAVTWSLSRFSTNALPFLREHLGSTNDAVRANSVDALALLGPDARTALPELIGRLQDPQPAVRSRTAFLLGQLGQGSDAALEALRISSASETNDWARAAAAEALHSLRKPPGSASPKP